MCDDAAEFTALRQTIGEGILRIIDDVSEPRLAGPILAMPGSLRINLLRAAVRPYLNDGHLTADVNGPGGNLYLCTTVAGGL